MSRVITLVAFTGLLAVSGCGSSDNLSTKTLRGIEQSMRQNIERQRKGIRVEYVHCPRSVKRKKGTVFTCNVKAVARRQGASGTAKATAVVTETDNKGSVHYVITKSR